MDVKQLRSRSAGTAFARAGAGEIQCQRCRLDSRKILEACPNLGWRDGKADGWWPKQRHFPVEQPLRSDPVPGMTPGLFPKLPWLR